MMKTILIVEDEPDIQELLCTYLRDAGYETAAAGDGVLAVELFRRRRSSGPGGQGQGQRQCQGHGKNPFHPHASTKTVMREKLSLPGGVRRMCRRSIRSAHSSGVRAVHRSAWISSL